MSILESVQYPGGCASRKLLVQRGHPSTILPGPLSGGLQEGRQTALVSMLKGTAS